MLISLDTETTGLDLMHGCKPFLVTTCAEGEAPLFWEWDVDPLTRKVSVPQEDVAHIKEVIEEADLIYLMNSQFDALALRTIGISLPWHKVRDTLVAGHLLASNHSHHLDDMVEEYLGVRYADEMRKRELKIKEVTQAVRALVKREHPDWHIAKEGEEDMPSVKGSSKRDEDKPWKGDMWLPRAYTKDKGKVSIFQLSPDSKTPNDTWLTACSHYACCDSEYTLPLGMVMERHIKQRGYWTHYEHRLQMMRCVHEMKCVGVTAIGEYTENTIDTYERYCAEASAELVCIAAEYGHDLELAQGAAINDNMRDFFYGASHLKCQRCGYIKRLKHWNGKQGGIGTACPKCLKGGRRKQSTHQPLVGFHAPNLNLHVITSKKSGNASLDKDAMQEYMGTLEGEALQFIKLLLDKRKHDTDLGYMQAYRRFWVPIEGSPGYYRIHPWINPCGTDHLRCSSNGPNLQNVGSQEDKCEECDGDGCDWCHGTGKTRTSVKNCFGPAPGREWYSMDYRQIENKLPMYEANEERGIEVFERPNNPPYWGSLYYLTASVLYPDEFWPASEFSIDHSEGFKKKYPRLYKQAKFFNLAKQYGAGRAKGDLLSKIRNSYDIIDSEFPKLAKLQKSILNLANKTGWVYTIPTRAIDPTKGYPLLASRTDDNYVLSTTPFNYHISGTACECKNLALIRCADQCAVWREEGFDAWMILEVHDELLFDFPKGKSIDSNLWRAHILRDHMEQSGKDLVPSIPTPVKVEYHSVTWAEGVAV